MQIHKHTHTLLPWNRTTWNTVLTEVWTELMSEFHRNCAHKLCSMCYIYNSAHYIDIIRTTTINFSYPCFKDLFLNLQQARKPNVKTILMEKRTKGMSGILDKTDFLRFFFSFSMWNTTRVPQIKFHGHSSVLLNLSFAILPTKELSLSCLI